MGWKALWALTLLTSEFNPLLLLEGTRAHPTRHQKRWRKESCPILALVQGRAPAASKSLAVRLDSDNAACSRPCQTISRSSEDLIVSSGHPGGHKSMAETLWQVVFNHATATHVKSTKQQLRVFSVVISNTEVHSFFHVFYYSKLHQARMSLKCTKSCINAYFDENGMND